MTGQTIELCRQLAARIRTTAAVRVDAVRVDGNGAEHRDSDLAELREAADLVADLVDAIGGAPGRDVAVLRVVSGAMTAGGRTDRDDLLIPGMAERILLLSDPGIDGTTRPGAERTAGTVVEKISTMLPLGDGWYIPHPWPPEFSDERHPGEETGVGPAIYHLRQTLAEQSYPDVADSHARAGLAALAGRWVDHV